MILPVELFPNSSKARYTLTSPGVIPIFSNNSSLISSIILHLSKGEGIYKYVGFAQNCMESKNYKVYQGCHSDQTTKIRLEGRVPANVSEIMKLRLGIGRTRDPYYYSFKHPLENNFSTIDGLAYHPSGEKVKVVLDYEHLKNSELKTGRIKPSSTSYYDGSYLSDVNSIELSLADYDKLEGEEFGAKNMRCIDNSSDPKSNPIWKALARHDDELLKDFVKYAFRHKNGSMWIDFLMDVNGEESYCHPIMGEYYFSNKRNIAQIISFTIDGGYQHDSLYGGRPLNHRGSFWLGLKPQKKS